MKQKKTDQYYPQGTHPNSQANLLKGRQPSQWGEKKPVHLTLSTKTIAWLKGPSGKRKMSEMIELLVHREIEKRKVL